jgi:four helix bundle protein
VRCVSRTLPHNPLLQPHLELDPDPMQERLSHENLRVYHVAIEFLALAVSLMERFPKGHSHLVDQLRRAALSIPLNIAEATGKPSAADNARYFAIARGSALECGAILDACLIMKLAENADVTRGKALLIPLVAMLSKLCRRLPPQKTGQDQDHV